MVRKSERQLSTRLRKNWLTTLRQNGARKKHGARSYRVVLDANIWLSAFLYGGLPERAVLLAVERCEVVASEDIIEEVFDYLRYRTDAPHRWTQRVRSELERICELPNTGKDNSSGLRDPRDSHVLAAAYTADCNCIITGDKDLLELDSYHGIAIIRTAEFLELIS